MKLIPNSSLNCSFVKKVVFNSSWLEDSRIALLGGKIRRKSLSELFIRVCQSSTLQLTTRNIDSSFFVSAALKNS